MKKVKKVGKPERHKEYKTEGGGGGGGG